MSETTGIEWTDSTWNPIRARRFEMQDDGGGRERIGWHCEHASDGCRNCYAERRNVWIGTGQQFKPAHLKHTTRHGDLRGDVEVFLDVKAVALPQRWRKGRAIFVCSMTDLFADFVRDEWIDQVFAVMSEAPWHRFQVLTKRAKRMRAYMTAPGREASIRRAAEHLAERDVIRLLDDPCEAWPLPHVILMVSAEAQREADERIPELLATPAACRGVSLEPMLGPINLRMVAVPADQDQLRRTWDIEGSKFNALTLHDDDRFHQPPAAIDWVICGGESGPQARPMHPDWARSLRDQCAAAGVPFLFKQWGEWLPWSQFSDAAIDDPPEQTRFRTREFFDGQWDDVGRPGYWEVMDGEVDDEHCVGRVGKARAGRLLDGVQHDGFPEAHR